MSRRPCTRPPSRRAAPVSPVSSSMVNSSSSGPCGNAVSPITASIAATPMPLSDPRVVPAAVRYSPCISGTMASVAKSNATSAFFSCTMSRWDWRTVMPAPSWPVVAGLRTTRLPAASAWWARPRRSADATMWPRMRPSSFDARGIVRMVSKCRHRAVGSRSLTKVMASPRRSWSCRIRYPTLPGAAER